MTFINGLTASAVASRGDWPAQKQIEQLRLQIDCCATGPAKGAAAAPRQSRAGSAPQAA